MPYPMKNNPREILSLAKKNLSAVRDALEGVGDRLASVAVGNAIDQIDISLAMIAAQRASGSPQSSEDSA